MKSKWHTNDDIELYENEYKATKDTAKQLTEIAGEKSCMETFKSDVFGEIRVVYKDGEPWFVAADVCKALEIENHKDAIKRLDNDEKSGVDLNDPHGRSQITNCISESGLYSLILGSRKKEAKAFKRWVTHEVIPSIRKHGIYATDEFLNKSEEERNKELNEIKSERDKLLIANKQIEKRNSELEYEKKMCEESCDLFGAISFSQLGDAYGTSVVRPLMDSGVVETDDAGFLCLTEPYKGKGYDKPGMMRNGKTFMMWTALGCIEVVYRIMKERYGMTPVRHLNFDYR